MAKKKRTTRKKTRRPVRRKVKTTRTARSKKKRGVSKSPAKTAAKSPRGGSLKSMSTSELADELERRRRTLLERREALEAELADVNGELARFDAEASGGARATRGTRKKTTRRTTGSTRGSGGTGRRGRRGAGAGGDTLVSALQKLLVGKEMRVREIVDAVQKAGYRTSSPNFRVIVNQTLGKHPDVFSRVARGVYTAKG